jgi:hypothetical protein
MAPIVDVQRRLHEVGRIRIGDQVASGNGTRPRRLQHFRFTSASRRPLEAVAGLYGGEVRPWEGAPAGEQFELYSTASELLVVLPPSEMAFSQFYELWSAGGCQRRCDGVHEMLRDGPCLCDADKRDCVPHTRLSVMLTSVPTLGLWRIDTGGWYAASELMGAADLAKLIALSSGRSIIPGRLRVEARTVKRPDPKKPDKVVTRNFVVPVLDFDVDIAAIAPGVAPRPLALEAPAPAEVAPPDTAPALPGLTPIPAQSGGPTLEDQLRAVDTPAPRARRSNSAPALPPTGRRPRTVDQIAESPRSGPEVSPPKPAPPASATSTPTATGDGSPEPAPGAVEPPESRPGEAHRVDIVRLRNEAIDLLQALQKKSRPKTIEMLEKHGWVKGANATLWVGSLDREPLVSLLGDLR